MNRPILTLEIFRPLQSLRRSQAIWVLLLAVVMTALPSVVSAQADPLNHEDRARSLYRVVVSLDGAGHPVLPVSVFEHGHAIEVSAVGGLRVLGTGDGSVEFRLPGSKPMTVTAKGLKAGRKDYWVAVSRAPANDMMSLRKVMTQWKAWGHRVRPRGVGATYGLKGRVLDTRATVLCLDEPFPSLKAARARAAALSAERRRDVFVHIELSEPPSARLLAQSGSAAEVRAADVLWFEAATPGGQLTVVGRGRGGVRKMLLPGRVYVVPGDGGGLAIVNEVRIETLLQGVVAAEIFSSAPPAALRAQAVAARTDLLAKVGLRHRSDPFSICSEVHCQAYRGARRIPKSILKAVHHTRGLVLTGPDGRLVDTFYHAASGGHTEHNNNAWRMNPHPCLRGHEDLQPGAVNHLANGPTEAAVKALLDSPDRSFAAASGKNRHVLRWVATRKWPEIRRHMAKIGVKKPIRSARILKRGVSGRVIEMELTLIDGTKRRIWGELRIRRAFRSLRSSLFILTPGPKGANGAPVSWNFRGAGFGHGVGLDQTGAYGRAKRGQKFKEILQHYYQGSRIEKLY
ncbi:MAG: SpoIID/LytB domain-containing protein [Myxococcales bacterium]|nr:SpoIID/LytB domain-containing protein [Myxococcales bacterium]